MTPLALLAAACGAPAPASGQAGDDKANQDQIVIPQPPVAVPRCFGAAARDPAAPCTNPALVRRVTPTPFDALLQGSAPCTPESRVGVFSVCAFGQSRALAQWNVALVGDSHAGHWRGALVEVAAQAGWRGRSMTRAGCAISVAAPANQPRERQRGCRRFNRAVIRFLETNPEISTVFVAANAENRQGPPSAFARAWRRLPASVRHIVVLRDTPQRTQNTFSCIQSAMARGANAGRACAAPRAAMLRPDKQVQAAMRWPSRRVDVIDLSRHMCSTRLCFPVVGGALVNRDIDHLTDTFARSLGPFLLRRLQTLMRRWADAPRRPRCAILPLGVDLTGPRGGGPPAAILTTPLASATYGVRVEVLRAGRAVLRSERLDVLPQGETKLDLQEVDGRAYPGTYTIRVTGTREACLAPATRVRVLSYNP